jgi:PAS domain S-box-containing protein/putative nucleotidyltransferase with HDIG domain
MKDDNKTKKQLIHELTELISQNAELKKSINGSIWSEIAAEEARRYAESIVGTVREPLLVLDADLKIISANRNFYRTFKVTSGETIGSFIYDLGNKQWDIPKLRELLEEILPEKEAFDDFEVDHNFQDIGHKIMLLNARQIYRKDIGAKMILLAIEDITERKEIENGLEKTRKELEITKISEDAAREYAESIINTVREPLIALDHDLRVVTASRSFYVVFKVKPEDTVGQLIYDLGNKQWDIPKLRELLETILPEKATFDNYEVEHDFATIGSRIMLLNARQIKRVFGKERIILLAIEDITERKRLEDLLTESEERYRRLFETASDGIVLLEKREGKITHANPATEKMLGYNKKDSIGNSLQDIGVFLDLGDFQTTMQNLNKIGILNYNDVPVETKSGQHIDTDIYLVDRARLVQCNIRDITERKRVQEVLRENEEKYREIFEGITDAFYRTDKEGILLIVSPSIEKLLGYVPDEAIGKNLGEIYVNPEERDQFLSLLLEKGEVKGFEAALRAKDGSVVFVSTNAQFYRDTQGNILGVQGLSRDVTERMLMEKALLESEERFRRLADATWEGIIIHREGIILDANGSFLKILGCNTEEVIGHSVLEFLAPESIEPALQILKEGIDLPQIYFEAMGLRKDKTVFPLELLGRPIRCKNLDARVLAIRDITDRKRAEEQLRQTLESLEKALGATIQVMVSAVESRDPYTAGHQLRSANLSQAIATEMGLPQDRIDGIRMAGSIHDIGKLSIPAEILSKPTKLTNIEFSLIKEHSKQGYEILKSVEFPWPLAEIVYQHHERADGSGYPRNLKGDDILMEARILAVSDVVEAMASHRPYRPALGLNEALAEIENNKGTLYDVDAVDACLRLFREKGYQLEGT